MIGAFQDYYNDLNQLAEACAPNCNGDIATYAYDRYGSRWSEAVNFTPPVTPENASFNGSNNRMDGYTYDAAGNLLNDGVHTYAYDAENRLISVDGGATASYVYDAEGRRVHENVGGVVKEYVYGQSGQELSVVDANQNLLQGETYFGGRYLGTAMPGGFNWAYADGQGTVRKRSNGEVDSNWPFGEFANLQNGVSQIHFTGKLRDSETNLDYFGARYYSSQLGRWMTPDWSPVPAPIPYANLENPQSLNLYAYVLNNPATATDPDGHWCFFNHIGTNCSKTMPKGTAKEGGVAAAGAAAGADVLGGAEAGAETGSAFEPGYGTLIGAVVGGVGAVVTTYWLANKAAGSRGQPRPSPNFHNPTNPAQPPPDSVSLRPGHSVRVMPPTAQYPDGYWVETNRFNQPVDPSTGRPPSNVTSPEARARTHVPLPPGYKGGS